MITRATESDHEKIASVWLEAALLDFTFLTTEVIHSNTLNVRNSLAHQRVWISTDKDQILGFVGMQGPSLRSLFVSPRAQNKGVGSSLLCFACEQQSDLTIEVLDVNVKALSFYKKRGFISVNRSVISIGGKPFHSTIMAIDPLFDSRGAE